MILWNKEDTDLRTEYQASDNIIPLGTFLLGLGFSFIIKEIGYGSSSVDSPALLLPIAYPAYNQKHAHGLVLQAQAMDVASSNNQENRQEIRCSRIRLKARAYMPQ